LKKLGLLELGRFSPSVDAACHKQKEAFSAEKTVLYDVVEEVRFSIVGFGAEGGFQGGKKKIK